MRRIDALCINQADHVEKSAQVRSIDKVYANAKQVIVWLGQAEDDAMRAYDFMLSRTHMTWPQGWEEAEDDQQALQTILALLA